jgi:3-dehydroquinate dehydratase-2
MTMAESESTQRRPTRILVVQGPNLNRLGRRKPGIYGSTTLEEIQRRMDARAVELGVELRHVQSNHEGVLVDFIHEQIDHVDAVIVNPAGLTNYGQALRDALEDSELPIAEVHLSNIHRREAWRANSFYSAIAVGTISGFGWRGYLAALDLIGAHLHEQRR